MAKRKRKPNPAASSPTPTPPEGLEPREALAPEEMDSEAAPAPTYRALRVGRRSLALLAEVFDSFASTGMSDWDAETMLRAGQDGVANPLFALWAVQRLPEKRVVGFLVAQVQPGRQQPEIYVLAVHILPGESLKATDPLGEVLFGWARALGIRRMVARTRRGDAQGLTEPAAWERFGFRYDSTLMVWEESDGQGSA